MKLLKLFAGKLPAGLERWKYPTLILLLGVALVLWPARSKSEDTVQVRESEPAQTVSEEDAAVYRQRTERELESVLSQIDGAGRVRVMLTLRTGPETRYQTDRSVTERSEGDRTDRSSEEKTVILDRGSAYHEPAVVTTAYPAFQGALILAEGGGDPKLRLELSAAVAALLGLSYAMPTVGAVITGLLGGRLLDLLPVSQVLYIAAAISALGSVFALLGTRKAPDKAAAEET